METDDEKRPEEKRGGHVRRGRHARGGKTHTKVNEYNAVGSPTMHEAGDEDADEFKKGGKAEHDKRKHGGHAEGEHEKGRMDRMPRGKHARGGRAEHEEMEKRGGRAHRAKGGRAGGSPYSTASSLTQMKGDAGREGQKVPPEPD